MKLDADADEVANAERRERVIMLEPAELALDGGATTVELAESLRVPLNVGLEARRPFNDRHDNLIYRATRSARQSRDSHSPRGADSSGVRRVVGFRRP